MAARENASQGPSLLLLEEYFSTQHAEFLSALRSCSAPPVLAAMAAKWAADPRQWARQQLLAYLDMPLDRPGHQVLVKRLFKHAETKKDNELMAAFMVAFDRLVRRRLVRKHHYDYRSRQSWQSERLIAESDGMPGTRSPTQPQPRLYQNPKTLQPVYAYAPPGTRLFSNPTRNHLRRRAWRYFRRMGYQKPAEYAAAVARALIRYNSDDLDDGIAILDSWSLMHACFFESPVIEFTPDHANLVAGRGLPELAAAPFMPELWQKPEAGPLLLSVLLDAKSRLVRRWSSQLLRAHHRDRLADLPPETLIRLLDHEDEELQQFAAELLSSASGLERLPLTTWLAMLRTRNLAALQIVADVMRRHVTPDRFELGQLVELASARPTPVARMGLEMLKARPITTRQQREQLAELAKARCASVGRELAGWALSILGAKEGYDADLVAPFFDSLTKEVREGAWEGLKPGTPAYDDPVLWSRLLETPYEDVRLRFIEILEARAGLPGTSPAQLAGTWAAVLLGIHRGGRQKLKAMRQIAGAIAADPAGSEPLIPVIAVAIRSVRPAEARPGLAALVSAIERHPPLAESAKRFIPELELSPQGAC